MARKLAAGPKDSCLCLGPFQQLFITQYYVGITYVPFIFQMTEENIRKYIEPFFHILAFAVSLAMSLLSLRDDGFHPSSLMSFCGPFKYPYWCTDESDCLVVGNPGVRFFPLYFLCIAFVTAILSLIVVVLSVYRQERNFRKVVNDVSTEADEGLSMTVAEYRNNLTVTKTITRQAMYYVAAFIAVYYILFIRSISSIGNEKQPILATSEVIQIMHVLLRPSQGVFNFLIFVHHKSWALRRGGGEYEYESSWYILKAIIFRGAEPAEQTPAIASLDLLRVQEERQRVIGLINLNLISAVDSQTFADLPSKDKSEQSEVFSDDSGNAASSFKSRDGFLGSVLGSHSEGLSYGTYNPSSSIVTEENALDSSGTGSVSGTS